MVLSVIPRHSPPSFVFQVKSNQLPTSDGISYLDAKYLLLLNYCSSLVYYLLRKAKGFSIEGHPVVRSLVEIRLFLEKVCLLPFIFLDLFTRMGPGFKYSSTPFVDTDSTY